MFGNIAAIKLFLKGLNNKELQTITSWLHHINTLQLLVPIATILGTNMYVWYTVIR